MTSPQTSPETYADEIEGWVSPEKPLIAEIDYIPSHYGTEPDPYAATRPLIGVPLDWETLRPFLCYEYVSDYGSPQCHMITIWTETRILTMTEYDGQTSPLILRRNPSAPVSQETIRQIAGAAQERAQFFAEWHAWIDQNLPYSGGTPNPADVRRAHDRIKMHAEIDPKQTPLTVLRPFAELARARATCEGWEPDSLIAVDHFCDLVHSFRTETVNP